MDSLMFWLWYCQIGLGLGLGVLAKRIDKLVVTSDWIAALLAVPIIVAFWPALMVCGILMGAHDIFTKSKD